MEYSFRFGEAENISRPSLFRNPIQTIGVEIMKHTFGVRYILDYKIGIIFFIVIPYSYFFYNKFIWKKK